MLEQVAKKIIREKKYRFETLPKETEENLTRKNFINKTMV